ncbi:uncharacterized protein LOC129570812, partial [Sitodiplosis mosellana]|uniref:uncharacterized protein LOC129570812 n=1 Tax=Sitodiplosis mosellana TaxID=263140 RepID=UPI002443C3E4
MGIETSYPFQQDNDPKHTAGIARDWLDENVPNELNTPPQSPDLNPIENLWDNLDRRIRTHKISNKNDLKNALEEEWSKIDTETTQKLVDSMQSRLTDVNWTEAVKQCESKGMELVSILSKKENDNLIGSIKEAGQGKIGFWTSGNRLETNGTYYRFNRSQVTFTDWENGKPDNRIIDGEEEKCVE